MANIDSTTLNSNVYMQAFGNGIVADGSITLSANPTAADVLRILRIPAGTRVSAILLANTDLDTNGTPTIVHSLGYAPVNAADGPAAAPTYFAAAGQTNLQAANEGKLYSKFAAITFDYDVYLTATVATASATFAAGTIYVDVIGTARGVK